MSASDQSRTPRPSRRIGFGGLTFPSRIHRWSVFLEIPAALAASAVGNREFMVHMYHICEDLSRKIQLYSLSASHEIIFLMARS